MSQSWKTQNPYPTESWLLTVEPVTDKKLFIGGFGGTLLKTTNSGQTWDIRKFNDLINISSISFKDSLNGWLADSKHIYKTIDGGDNWKKINIQIDTTTYTIHDIFCFEKVIYLVLPPLSAYAGDENFVKSIIMKSTDDGNNWQQLDQEIKGRILCEYFINDSVGFFGVSQSGSYFYKTNDGGKTLIKRSFPGGLGAKSALFFLDDNFGFMGEYKTTDGGLTWENIFTSVLSQTESVEGIYFSDIYHGWGITSNSIFQTVDGGLTWQIIDNQATGYLQDINFSSNGTGWVVGWEGNIFRKESLHDTWQSLSKGTRNNLRDVYFVDEFNGWAVGDIGCIMHTSNGGDTWEEQLSPVANILFKIKFLNKFEGWIAGYGVFLHTVDGGNSWEIKSDLVGTFVDIDFFDDKNGILIERSGALFRTNDGGINWQLTTDKPLGKQLTCIAIVNGNEAWIGGYGGLGHTVDKGTNIQWYDIPNLSSVTKIQFVDNNIGFLCNDFGDFLGTIDGGQSWQKFQREQGLQYGVTEFYALNKDTVWLYLWPGLPSSIVQTYINAQSIVLTDSPSFLFDQINSIFFVNRNTGWAVGSGGAIVKYSVSSTFIPYDTVQKRQPIIYPNPFSSTGVNIAFLLQQTQKITIDIYNCIGQKVQTLYNGITNKGNQVYFWRPKGIASGIYFISIYGDNLNLVQKCLFINH